MIIWSFRGRKYEADNSNTIELATQDLQVICFVDFTMDIETKFTNRWQHKASKHFDQQYKSNTNLYIVIKVSAQQKNWK